MANGYRDDVSVAEVLRNAHDHMKAHGWTKGQFFDADGGCCIVGAMSRGSPGTINLAAQAFLQERLLAGEGPSWFNDHQCESIDDALALLEIGADIAEVEGL